MRRFSAVLAVTVFGGCLLAPPASASDPSPAQGRQQDVSLAFASPLRGHASAPNARSAAVAHLNDNAASWGLAGVSLDFLATDAAGLGARTARFHQVIGGLPVLGSLVAVTVGRSNEVLSVTAHTAAAPAQRRRLDAAAARAALAAQLPASASFAPPTAAVMAEGYLPATGSRFVWTTTVTGWKPTPQFVVLDDATGRIAASSPTIRQAVDSSPLVCDDGYSPTKTPHINLDVPATIPLCPAATAVTDPSGVADEITRDDLIRARDAIGATATYFSTHLRASYASGPGVDISSEALLGNIAPASNYGYVYGSGVGPALTQASDCVDAQTGAAVVIGGVCTPRISAYVNVCRTWYGCPYMQQAYWVPWQSTACASGYCSGVFFGRSWAVDDVVAHEVTHGITANTFPDLLSEETNALAEAYSDIFGEAVDQLTVDPGEAPDPLWRFGEDIGYSRSGVRYTEALPRVGPLRDVSVSYPGGYRTIATGWDTDMDAYYALGPADRLAWLLANGGTQGGWTIRSLGTTATTSGDLDGLCDSAAECTGIIRMTQLMYQALPKLPAHATYFDFGRAVIQACSDLTVLAVEGFTTSSCTNVRSALSATRIWRLSLGSGFTALKPRAANTPSVIRAYVLTSTGAPQRGIRASLQVRRRSSGAWTTVATKSSDSRGCVRFTVSFSSSRYYRVVTKSSTTVPYASTPIRRVIVQ